MIYGVTNFFDGDLTRVRSPRQETSCAHGESVQATSKPLSSVTHNFPINTPITKFGETIQCSIMSAQIGNHMHKFTPSAHIAENFTTITEN